MSAEQNLSSKQLGDYTLLFNKGDESHTIETYKGKYGPVGHFEWDANTGHTKDVNVSFEHQRKGLATAMWNMAQTAGVTKPVHSDVLSEQGAQWKRSLK
jgi:hypothetical protein